jgi:hypothetical protein
MERLELKETYFWVHTSFSAVSMAFFLGLLGAQQTTIDTLSIEIASVFFCISVISNAGLALFLIMFGRIGMYVNRIYLTIYPWQHLNSLPAISIISFILGIIFLFGYYSYCFSFIAVIVIFYTGYSIQSKMYEANNELKGKQ